jgi:hypothetical protein
MFQGSQFIDASLRHFNYARGNQLNCNHVNYFAEADHAIECEHLRLFVVGDLSSYGASNSSKISPR